LPPFNVSPAIMDPTPVHSVRRVPYFSWNECSQRIFNPDVMF
jgi:hypothetical protein